MISYNTLLNEIEKHLQLAKSTNQNQQLREQLSAIRALCDVGLVQQTNEETTMQINTSSLSQQMITNIPSSPTKWDEEDGKGASIFDF